MQVCSLGKVSNEVLSVKIDLTTYCFSHLSLSLAGQCSLVVRFHTVWQLPSPPHTQPCLFFHTPPLKPCMIDHYDTHHREGNSSYRQASQQPSDSNLIQNFLDMQKELSLQN